MRKHYNRTNQSGILEQPGQCGWPAGGWNSQAFPTPIAETQTATLTTSMAFPQLTTSTSRL